MCIACAYAQTRRMALVKSRLKMHGSLLDALSSWPTLEQLGKSSSEASVPTEPDLLVHPVSSSTRLLNRPIQTGIIEQGAPLLKLDNNADYNEQILIRAAKHSEENDRITEAIKLYNLAGDYTTVITCLAHALGNTISLPSGDENARSIERTAAEILRHYERTNRAVGKDRDAVIRLLRVREAMDAKEAGRVELVLEVNSQLLWYLHGFNVRFRSWSP